MDADGTELNYSIHEKQVGDLIRGLISVSDAKQLPSSVQLEIDITQLFRKQGEWRFSFPLERQR
ncbi:hypothetical protein OH784_16480 [Ectobacillus funiculus]|uniref:hypothetical protein n=1 Tax=Ectobacillus funiculus TaxID=137993 RepID=UPI00397CEA15